MNFAAARNFGLEQHRKYLEKQRHKDLDPDQVELGNISF